MHMKSAKNHNLGFTLIELLVVIAIMVIMLLFAAPAFQDIGRGNRMRSAVHQLTTTLNLARQWAITKREPVYVIFPDDHKSLYQSNAEHKDKALRAYVVFTRSQGFVTEWRYLPAGVYFVDPFNSSNFDSDDFFSEQNNIFRGSILTNMPFPDMKSQHIPITALLFEPDGSLGNGGGVNPVEIYLAEAAFAEAESNEPLYIQWKTVGQDGSVIRAVSVSPHTGLTRVIDSTQFAGD